MEAAFEIEASATERGRAIKRNNAWTAVVFGSSVALLLATIFPFKPLGAVIGFLIGLVYANAFEYVYHRFLLHQPQGFFGQQHLRHHSTWGEPDEALFVNFADNPWRVVALFAINTVPFVAVEWVFRPGLVSGVLVGFVLYFVAFEEIHWRIHLGGWLPSGLQFARRHHLTHHAAAEERFNVFLPLLDWLLGTQKK